MNIANLLKSEHPRILPLRQWISRQVTNLGTTARKRRLRHTRKRIESLEQPPRRKGAVEKRVNAWLQKAGAYPPIQRVRRKAAKRICAKLGIWAQKAESAGYLIEARFLQNTRRIIDGTDKAYNKAMLRILSRPRPPREYPAIDPEKLLWSQWFLEFCMRSMLLELPKEPGPNRKIIRWFSWDADLSAPDINFMSMMQRIYLVIKPKGWQFLTFRNYGSIELGSLTKSVSRREFFQFQKKFDAILKEVDLKASGFLTLTWSDSESKRDPDDPHEQYKADRLTFGDGNGRPRRHVIPVLPVLPGKEGCLST